MSRGRSGPDDARLGWTSAFWSGFQTAAVGMALTAADLELVAVNETLARLLGATPRELHGRRAVEMASAEEVATLEAMLRVALEGKVTPPAIEITLASGAEQVRRTLVSASAVPDEDGRTTGLLIHVQDVTSRRVAEDALQASEDRFRLLVDSIEDYAIIMLDAEGRVETWNTGAERLTGYTEHEIVGRHFRRFYTAEDQALRVPDRLLDQARSGGSVRVEGWRLRKDGSRFWGEVAISALHTDGDRAPGFAKITRDLTHRHQVEETLRRSQKMEALGRLAGGVSHDFNNLLAAILGYGEVLRERLAHDPDARSDVHQIVAAAERARDLVAQLLAFSRDQETEQVPVDLSAAVQGVEPMLRRLLSDAIVLETDLARSSGTVRANRGHIEQLVINLVTNAQDSMPSGGAIRLRVRPAAEGHVILSVSDTGSGMDNATRERAFDPFFTTKAVGEGTGLGLSTVYGIAHQSGGDVEIASAPGEGTTVTVRFPLTDDAPEPSPSSPSPKELRDQPAMGTVLLVEDEEAVRSMLKLVLSQRGYDVLEAGDGVAALAIAREHPGRIDLLVTDVSMPRLNGPALVQELRKEGLDPSVIYISGFAGQSLDLSAGERFLQKPFSLAELIDTAAEFLGGQ